MNETTEFDEYNEGEQDENEMRKQSKKSNKNNNNKITAKSLISSNLANLNSSKNGIKISFFDYQFEQLELEELKRLENDPSKMKIK